MLIECSDCSQSISDKAKNCPKCGAPVEPVMKVVECLECGAEIGDGASSCNQCGAPNEGLEIAASPPESFRPYEPQTVIVREGGGFNINWEWVAIFAVAIAAVFSKPELSGLERKIASNIRAAILSQRITSQDDLATGLMKFGCALDVKQCTQMIRAQVRVKERDIVVARVTELLLSGAKTTCLGAFRNWWCWEDE